MSKKSIRFFNDREVRAVWDDEHSECGPSVYGRQRALYAYLARPDIQEAPEDVRGLEQDRQTGLSWCDDSSHTDSTRIHELQEGALAERIDDREIFMKGIDYSYYYEQED